MESGERLLLRLTGEDYLIIRKKYTIICAAAILLILFIINFISRSRDLKLSNEFLDSILLSNINDKEILEKNGFKLLENSYVLHYDNENALCCIVVIFDDAPPSHAKPYKNLSYNAKESGMGILNPKRLYTKEIPVERRCLIYMDGVTINILEDNVEKSSFAFEEYFLNKFINK